MTDEIKQEQPVPSGPQAIDPNAVVIAEPMTARDVLLMACRNDPSLLAQAVMTGPEAVFQLKVEIAMTFRGKDAHDILRSGGFEITFPENGNGQGNNQEHPA